MSEPTIEDKFASIFEGYQESFVKHVPPFTLEEGTGKLKAKSVCIAEYRSNSKLHPAPPEGVEEKAKIPVTRSKYDEHLNGGDALAVSPLFDLTVTENGKKVVKKDVCNFGIIDIDCYDRDYFDLVRRLYSFGYKFSAFVSKSGGLHVWFIFGKAESAKDVRAALAKIVELFGLNKIYSNSSGSRVEVFPQHDTRTPDMHDKYVFLPFYNALNDTKNPMGKMYNAEGTYRGIKKGIADIEKMFTTLKEITDATGRLPFADAPFCIQALLLSGVLYDGNHRNDFLFNTSLYLKLKHGEGFELSHLEEANKLLGEPKPTSDLQAIFNSATKKEEGYQLAGRCGSEPVCNVCDRTLCKLREFGVGKKKGNLTSTVEFGKIVRVMAEEPYYLWEARLAGTEEWKTLKINEADGLLNQKTAQVACIKVLNTIPPTMAPPAWEAEVIRCLSMIEEKPAPKATDTTDMAELRDLFNRYLTHRKVKNNVPHTVNVKQVYYEDGYYYFQTNGLQAFLRSQSFKNGRVNLREELLRYGCTDATLTYRTSNDEERVIECWRKQEDEHTKKLGTYYEDVVETDTMTIMNNKLNKGAEKKADDEEDDRF